MASGLLVEQRCSEGLEPQLDSRVMPYKPWLRAFVDTEHTIHMIVFNVNYLALLVWIHEMHVAYCFLNKVAYARAGAHTLLKTELFV